VRPCEIKPTIPPEAVAQVLDWLSFCPEEKLSLQATCLLAETCSHGLVCLLCPHTNEDSPLASALEEKKYFRKPIIVRNISGEEVITTYKNGARPPITVIRHQGSLTITAS